MSQTLLLADDSITVQRVIELTFQDEGMRVVSVGDGRQAIEHLERDRPDIVLADVSMPEQDGYEVAAYVKHTPHLAHIPVVLMTGAFDHVDEERAKDVGCDGVLSKPFEPHMAIALVRQLLGKPPANRRANEAPASDEPSSALAAGYPFDSSTSTPAAKLDEYFDRLDEALAGDAAPGEAPPPPQGLAEVGPARDGGETAASPVTEGATVAASDATAPHLADAFSALLAEELAEAPAGTWARPAAAPGAAVTASIAVSDQLVEAVSQRVVERLSNGPLRQLMSDHVLSVAERLVREEIERIKAAARG